jgi:hypothetical protein
MDDKDSFPLTLWAWRAALELGREGLDLSSDDQYQSAKAQVFDPRRGTEGLVVDPRRN